MDKAISKAISKALQEEKRKGRVIAGLVGCSEALVSEIKNGNRIPGGYAIKFCEVLGIDPFTGEKTESSPSPTVRARVRPGAQPKRGLSKKPSALLMDDHEDDLPDEMDLSPEEARAVLLARKHALSSSDVRALLYGGRQGPSVAHAVGAVLGGDYLEAIRICTALAAGSMTRRRG